MLQLHRTLRIDNESGRGTAVDNLAPARRARHHREDTLLLRRSSRISRRLPNSPRRAARVGRVCGTVTPIRMRSNVCPRALTREQRVRSRIRRMRRARHDPCGVCCLALSAGRATRGTRRGHPDRARPRSCDRLRVQCPGRCRNPKVCTYVRPLQIRSFSSYKQSRCSAESPVVFDGHCNLRIQVQQLLSVLIVPNEVRVLNALQCRDQKRNRAAAAIPRARSARGGCYVQTLAGERVRSAAPLASSGEHAMATKTLSLWSAMARVLLLLPALLTGVQAGDGPPPLALLPKRFIFARLNETKPRGWLLAQSRIQADTLGGHLEYFFVNNSLWMKDYANLSEVPYPQKDLETVPYW